VWGYRGGSKRQARTSPRVLPRNEQHARLNPKLQPNKPAAARGHRRGTTVPHIANGSRAIEREVAGSNPASHLLAPTARRHPLGRSRRAERLPPKRSSPERNCATETSPCALQHSDLAGRSVRSLIERAPRCDRAKPPIIGDIWLRYEERRRADLNRCTRLCSSPPSQPGGSPLPRIPESLGRLLSSARVCRKAGLDVCTPLTPWLAVARGVICCQCGPTPP
jgi:hypothetical protein